MGITAAMEVWPAQKSGSSSSSHTEENGEEEEEPNLHPCPEGENHTYRGTSSTQLGQLSQNAEDDEDQKLDKD